MFKALIKETALYSVTDVIFRLVNFALFPLLTYFLTVSEFGINALMLTLAILIGKLSSLGLYQSLQRFYLDGASSPEERKTLLSTVLWSVFISTLAMAALFSGAAFLFRGHLSAHNDIDWMLILLVSAGCIPMQLFNYSLSAFRLNFTPRRYLLYQTGCTFFGLALSLTFLIAMGWGVVGLAAGQALGYLCFAPLALRAIGGMATLRPSMKTWKTLIAFGFPFFLTDSAQWVVTSVDRWMLGELADNDAVGLYSIAFKIATVMLFLMNAFGMAWGPRAMKSYGEDLDYPVFFSRCFTGWFCLLVFAATGLSLFGPEALRLLTPEEYWPAMHLIPAITMGLAFYGTTQVSTLFVSIPKKNGALPPIIWGCSGLNMALNFLWIPSYGALGAAYATLASYVLLGALYLRAGITHLPVKVENAKIAICLLMGTSGLIFSQWCAAQPPSNTLLIWKCLWLIAFLAIAYGVDIVRIPFTKQLWCKKSTAEDIPERRSP